MDLELAITSYQRLSPTVISSMRFQPGQSYALGRSKDCDWYLPDPDRVISSRHGEIFSRDGQFYIRDMSTNGIFVNGATEALGEGSETVLRQGDQLRFGDYEFGVTLADGGAADTLEPETFTRPVDQAPVQSAAAVQEGVSTPGDVPLNDNLGMGGNPMLASGLSEQRLGDSHVEVPAAEIPPAWQWGSDTGSSGPAAPKAKPVPAQDSTDSDASGEHLAALFQGMGMTHLAEQAVSPAMLRDLGELTRILLDRLLDLLHARAQQKQKLRVTQTLFQRTENNPLKFSVTAQDALEALLIRRHGSFMGHRDAVESAFDDVLVHERALMTGVERVLTEILQANGESGRKPAPKRFSLIRKARAYDELMLRRARHSDEFGDANRMLCSDAFVEAYEEAVSKHEQE